MRLWVIPMMYVAASLTCGLVLPRIEQAYFGAVSIGLSVGSAQACLSAAASGMMALTSLIFAMAFVMVQFSAIAYSPRLVLWLARDRILFHSLGVFSATFIYALFALAWVDRDGSGAVPTVSMLLVGSLLLASMLLFSWLVQRLTALQITNVLQLLGDADTGAQGATPPWRTTSPIRPRRAVTASTKREVFIWEIPGGRKLASWVAEGDDIRS
jgi:uncharacterized membrane protein